MAKTRTSWAKGQSGNPAGRRPNARARDAIRKALNQPAEPGADATRLDRWATEIVTQAMTMEDRLAVLKFLEGSSPPQEPDGSGALQDIAAIRDLVDDIKGAPDADRLFGPRIRIPGAGGS